MVRNDDSASISKQENTDLSQIAASDPKSGVSPNILKSEEGNALIEFLFCFPFVFLVFISSIDLGRALEVGSFNTVDLNNPTPGHQLVRNRVDTLLIRYGINPGTLPCDYLTTARIQTAGEKDYGQIASKSDLRSDLSTFPGNTRDPVDGRDRPYLFLG